MSDVLSERAAKWELSLPEAYLKARQLLGPDDEIGFWTLGEPDLDPAVLDPGGPIGLFPIATNGMGDFLCFHAPSLGPGDRLPVVMWNPETQRLTRVGKDFTDFLKLEMASRVDFLVERGAALSADAVEKIRADESPDLGPAEGDARVVTEMLADACRVILRLGLDEALLQRATGASVEPLEKHEVDGADQNAIDAAIRELEAEGDSGDGSSAFEVAGYYDVIQQPAEVAKYLFKACRCLLTTWPKFSPERMQGVVQRLKESAADLPPADRVDPLFAFVTSQPATKPAARLSLAKQYLRKGQHGPALREAQNAMFLSVRMTDETDKRRAELAEAYAFLIEVFRSQNRPREQAYCELQQAKLAA